MLNEGVSKQAHPLFLRVNAQTHFLGQYPVGVTCRFNYM